MNSLYISVQAVFPLFTWMLLGIICRMTMKLTNQWISSTNNLLFTIFLPIMMFLSMYDSNLTADLNKSTIYLIVFSSVGITITFFTFFFITPLYIKDKPTCAAFVQGACKPNTALYCIPIAQALYGEGNIGSVTLVAVVLVPLYNSLSVFCLEYFNDQIVDFRKIFKGIITNPLFLSVMVGLIMNLIQIPIGVMLHSSVKGLAGCATPLAFFVLGAGFSIKSAAVNYKLIAVAVLSKLILIPFFLLSLAVAFQFRGIQLATILVVFAVPTSVSSYTMACAMGAKAKLSNEIIVFTSSLSVLSIFFWVFVLDTLALI